ncbi:MAG: enoyl-CoA hydratase [Deltaproteobacteria bacterium]|nr:enoyl-CoA hydratase [Deltaproteobacteria bacterium]MBW2386105.1 enoyl-CoA hydratase [Deltaproteobacteria bacterium]
MTQQTDYERIRVDRPGERVARITLARADRRNAQDYKMLYEIDDAFSQAIDDDDVRTIVLAADGPDFSSGHDLSAGGDPIDEFDRVTEWGGFGKEGAEGYYATEQEVYVGLCWRWRNLPKPTIAQVQGRVIAGGLMLVWPCDLIVCSEDASFSDPVTAFGVNGHEFFVHPWEVGARKAKEMLFSGEAIDAETALRLGMVNHVVPLAELEKRTLALAERIAERPSFGLTLAKRAVNHALDGQGQWTTIQNAMGLHHLAHTHNRLVHNGLVVDPAGFSIIKKGAKRG